MLVRKTDQKKNLCNNKTINSCLTFDIRFYNRFFFVIPSLTNISDAVQKKNLKEKRTTEMFCAKLKYISVMNFIHEMIHLHCTI